MRLRPMPVVMCSSLTERGAAITLEALALGAVDFVTKPRTDVERLMPEYAPELIARVKAAARARLQPLREEATIARPAPRVTATAEHSDQIIGIGASTGGIGAIRDVLAGLPPDVPGIVMAQHLPGGFTASFADRLARSCALDVCEAKDGQPILRGHAYLAPGERHLRVERNGSHHRCRVTDDAPVNRHRPSVDVLFRSLAQEVGAKAIGVLLTGMGRDGAEGLGEMLAAGGATLAQDEETSVVWGMPGAACRIGAAQSVHPITQIASRIRGLVAQRSR
jgi:two-component system chemotaxis response regulator CheB